MIKEPLWKFVSTWITLPEMVLGLYLGVALTIYEPAIAQEETPLQKPSEEAPPQGENLNPIPEPPVLVPPLPPPPQQTTPEPTPTPPPPAQLEKIEEETLQLEKPVLAPPPKEEPPSLGPFSNINIGGLLDYRYIPAPRTTTSGSGFLVIHVNELFISTNIGENISILAEQLLLTSENEIAAGQDHGFVYAIFTNIPFLPSDLSFKIGRFRFRYGIDAVSDSAINPVRTLVYKSIGFIADRGLELSGFWRRLEFSAAVLDGPDTKQVDFDSSFGTTCCVTINSGNTNRPIALRASLDIHKGPQVGLSYFNGDSYPVANQPGFDPDTMIFDAEVDYSKLIRKELYSIDAKYSIWRLDFAGEYTRGTEDFVNATNDVEGFYFRTDLTIIPGRFKWLFQYDLWKDGDSLTQDDPGFSTAPTVNISEQFLMRAAYLLNLNDLSTYALIIQMLLTF